MLRPRTIAGCACIALGVTAGRADAAAVTFDRPCYSPGEPITETGSGFTPASTVAETLSLMSNDPPGIVGSFAAPPAPVDAAGAFVRELDAPGLGRASDRQETAVSAFTDQAAPTVPVTAQWTLSGWDMEITSQGGKVARRGMMDVDTWGWTSHGQTLYGHWYRKGKRIKSARIGVLAAPCGDLAIRTRQFPFNAKPGKWRVYFSATSPLDKVGDAWIAFSVRLKPESRRGRTAGAHAFRRSGFRSGTWSARGGPSRRR